MRFNFWSYLTIAEGGRDVIVRRETPDVREVMCQF